MTGEIGEREKVRERERERETEFRILFDIGYTSKAFTSDNCPLVNELEMTGEIRRERESERERKGERERETEFRI